MATPALTSLLPNFGPAAGFNSVAINGSGFANVGPLAVRFGTTATTFTINSDTLITAIAPPGTGTVQVTVQALLDGTSNGLPYTYSGGPAPSGVIYVADGLSTVYQITTAGAVSTAVTLPTPGPAPIGVALSPDGTTLYIATNTTAVYKWTVGGLPTSATLLAAIPTGVAFGITA